VIYFGGMGVGRLTAGATATPLTANVCGEFASLSFTLSVAVNVPAVVGLNEITIPQFAPIARLVPQVLVSENAVAFAPTKLMLVIARAAVPELVSVMLGAVFVVPTVVELKLSVCADSVATGAGVTPVPFNVINCGEPNALSEKLNDALSAPIAAGLNTTVTAQDAPAATLVPQVFVWVHELAFVPTIAIPRPVPLKLSATLPEFFSVTDWLELANPSEVAANVNAVAENAA
jgi:hypothetical protein